MAPLSRRTRAGYAVGGVASGTYGTVPGLVLMPFLTDLIGVEAVVAGLIVFAPKAWDFVLNPIAGTVSDRSRHPHDRRRPFILRAGVLLAVAFVAMFLGPTTPPVLGALWVLAFSLVAASAYAFFHVPYLAMSAEITDDYAERTSLMTWRVIVFTLAILVAGGTAPVLADVAGGVQGYRLMAGVMAVLVLSGAIGVWWFTRGVPLTRHEAAGGRLGDQLRLVLANRDARALATAFVLQAVAMGMVLSGIVYAARHVVRDPSLATLSFVCFVGPAVVLTPVWSRLSRTLGKKRGFVAATVVMVVGLIALLSVKGGSPVPFLLASGVIGVGYAGAQLFPLAMLPDIAAEDARVSGTNRIGVITGVWSGFELLGYACGPALLGLVLSLGGYAAGASPDTVQPASAQWAIVLGISVIPASLCALSLLPLSRYQLDTRLRTRQT